MLHRGQGEAEHTYRDSHAGIVREKKRRVGECLNVLWLQNHRQSIGRHGRVGEGGKVVEVWEARDRIMVYVTCMYGMGQNKAWVSQRQHSHAMAWVVVGRQSVCGRCAKGHCHCPHHHPPPVLSSFSSFLDSSRGRESLAAFVGACSREEMSSPACPPSQPACPLPPAHLPSSQGPSPPPCPLHPPTAT